jgi:hypothetical protein
MKAARLAIITLGIWSGGIPMLMIYLGWLWYR